MSGRQDRRSSRGSISQPGREQIEGEAMKWKVGDIGWRGYARHYGNPKEWWPEIRPARVVKVNDDGTLDLHMEGIIPGSEGKRNPGSWVGRNMDPSLLHRTPETALKQARRAAVDARAETEDKAA